MNLSLCKLCKLVSQGAGKLTVIGPPGLKSYIELMTPFINRKYPELIVVEIDSTSPPSELELALALDYIKLQFLPLYSTLVRLILSLCIVS